MAAILLLQMIFISGYRAARACMVRRVVGLHVVHHQIVQRTAVQDMLDILEKDAAHGPVHGVEEHRLLVHQQVGIIGNASGHRIDALEQGQPAVITADPIKIFRELFDAIHPCVPP